MDCRSPAIHDRQQADLLVVLQAGVEEPPQTTLRLERMRRTLPHELADRPEDGAEALVACERGRMLQARQLERALLLLGERNAEVAVMQQALQEASLIVAAWQSMPWWRRVLMRGKMGCG